MSPSTQSNGDDEKKYAYHEGARLLRELQDHICERTQLGTAIPPEERELMCDKLIEAHQLLYNITLHTLHRRGVPGAEDSYLGDEVYDDGRAVVTRSQSPSDPGEDTIPTSAYRSDIGEENPLGVVITVRRPGESSDSGWAFGDAAEGPTPTDHWKASADLRACGFLEWVRDEHGRIVKRAGFSGRLQAASQLTPEGVAEARRVRIDLGGRGRADDHR